MKFCRIVERGNRQILMTIENYTNDEGEDEGYCLVMETHIEGDNFGSICASGFKTHTEAEVALLEPSDDEIMVSMMEVLDIMSSDDSDE